MMKGNLSEMLRRMTDLYFTSDSEGDDTAPLLPETFSLLDYLADLTWTELDFLNGQDSDRIASYRAIPEPNLPFLKFRVAEADPNLLRFTGQNTAGFEVLQVFCKGFQYHWRSDLSRAFEEQVPLVSRIYGLSGPQELVVEHLVVPLLRKHRVREIRGWFAFNRDLDACGEWTDQDADTIFRRTEHSSPVRLPTQLWDPERRRIYPAGLFRAMNRSWRDAKGPRRP
jgi:hypothetical protein